MKLSKQHLPQILACLLAANGSFVAGINIGWSSQIQERLVDKKEYGYEITREEFNFVASLLALGGAFGGLLGSILLHQIGRKWTIIMIFIPYAIGWGLMLIGINVIMLYVGRFILGLCSGGFLLVVPIYVCEVADKEIRGLLGTFQQLFMVLGIEFVYVSGPFMSVRASSYMYLVYPLVVAIPFAFMPESPRFLVSRSKYEKAEKAMRFFYGKNYDFEGEIARLTTEAEEKPKLSCGLIGSELRKFEVRYAALVVFVLHVFQQACGIRGVMFYATHIFREAIQDTNAKFPPSAGTIILGAIQVLSVATAMIVVDRSGRKILLIVSGSSMAVVTFLMGGYFHFKFQDSDALPRYIPVILACLYIVVYSLGFGPVVWIFTGELFPLTIKEFSVGFAVLINWLSAFIVTGTYNPTQKALGLGAVFWIYMSTIIFGIVFTILFAFETKGLSLGEVQEKMKNRELFLWSLIKSNNENDVS